VVASTPAELKFQVFGLDSKQHHGPGRVTDRLLLDTLLHEHRERLAEFSDVIKMVRYPTGLSFLWRSVVEHRLLIARLVKREFEARFRGHLFGIFWAFVTPLLTAMMFTFVFSTVFRARWGTGTEHAGAADFAIIFLTGMIVHTIFAEAISRAPTLILTNANYVTKVVFPLEILPLVTVATALINATIGLTIVLAGNLFLNGTFQPTIVLLPIVLLPFLILVLALVLFFAALGTYVRDISQILGLVVMASLFLTPIFYPVEAVPEGFRLFVRLNPLTLVVEQARAVVLYGHLPDFMGLGLFLIVASIALAFSFWMFQRLRGGFADVL
jgi:lipopolysaccharide transport system permease protein